MKFMNVIARFGNRNDMVNFRNQMLDEAERLLGEGEIDEYNAKLEDVKTFDNEYEEYTTQKANIEALKGAVKPNNAMGQDAQGQVIASMASGSADNDRAYRNAFMNFVLKGAAIPQEFRNADAYTTSGDVSAVIPDTVLEKIIEKIETTGTILKKVTRTFYKGGVTVPTSAAKPTATWTSERGTTDSQKKAVGSITFSYFKLRCVVAVSLTVDVVTLEVFERTLSSNIAEAMTKALEEAIIKGEGASKNQPEGILTKTAPEGQNVDIAAGKDITYKDLCSAEGALPSAYNAAEGALPSAYNAAEWAMTKKTYFGQIVGMTDSNGQPIARTNMGLDGKPQYTILGRPVNFIESGHMQDFAEVTKDTVVAFMFRFEDYMLNTNMNITVTHYDDNDTDDKMTKAVMLADGKVVDTNSYTTLTKKKAS